MEPFSDRIEWSAQHSILNIWHLVAMLDIKKNLSVEETTAVILSRAYTDPPDDADGALLI